MEIMVDELSMLWEHGILVNGTLWRVALISGIWDGKGYEMVTKTMGAGSLKGCNVCNFNGISFGETVKYPFYARYTLSTDTRRLRRPTGCPNANVMFNLKEVVEPPPQVRLYADYKHQGLEVLHEILEAKVNGVHGPWILDRLTYGHLIHPTKDAMHCSHNTIRDSIKLFKPNTSNPYFVNRTKRPAVLNSCRNASIFPFMTRELNPIWPWIVSKEECVTHDSRFEHVLGTYLNHY